MDNADKKRFAEIFNALGENFSANVTPVGLNFRFQALISFTIEQVESAATEIVRGRKYTKMPTIAEFFDYINGGSLEDFAEVEATKVWGAVSKYGATYNMVFDDATTMAVIVNGFGSWVKLCAELTEDQRTWFIKEFVKMYGAMSRRGMKHYDTLIGAYDSGPPKFIGDLDKCMRIMLEGEKEKKPQITIGALP